MKNHNEQILITKNQHTMQTDNNNKTESKAPYLIWWEGLELSEQKRLMDKHSDKTNIFYSHTLTNIDKKIIYTAEHPQTTKGETEERGKVDFTGGWEIFENGSQFANRTQINESGEKIFVIEHYTDTERERIEKLVSAAPAMYEALKTIANCAEDITKFPLTKSDAKGFVKTAQQIITTIQNK